MSANTPLETDYLVIGAGATGMAFVDTLVAETDAHVTVVDRHGKPGGHWNDAYPFVTLHQPSAFYGVNSTELGSGRIDGRGLNQGLHELASGPEICGYYDRVMNHTLLPTGRVDWRPMSNWLGGEVGADGGRGTFESLLSGQRTEVVVRRKVVDATWFSPPVPSTHTPKFSIAAGVDVVPPNALPQLWHRPARGGRPTRFVVLGAGKTAMDALIWLLQSGADPDSLHWVMPRDSWLINRLTTQPGPAFFEHSIGSQADQMQAFATATSLPDLYARLEACGALLRIHPDREPTMFHLATVSTGEVQQLRRIRHVIRLGRAQALEPGRLVLDQGTLPMPEGTLYVDCTASAVDAQLSASRPSQPVFQPGKLMLQLVRLPQPAFSAALLAYVEAHYDSDAAKNRLCTPVPFPHRMEDYPRAMAVNMWNQMQWGQDKTLRQWVRESRLDGFGKLMVGIDPADTEKLAIVAKLKEQAGAAMANVQKLLSAGA
jgi:hypothetical protein